MQSALILLLPYVSLLIIYWWCVPSRAVGRCVTGDNISIYLLLFISLLGLDS